MPVTPRRREQTTRLYDQIYSEQSARRTGGARCQPHRECEETGKKVHVLRMLESGFSASSKTKSPRLRGKYAGTTDVRYSGVLKTWETGIPQAATPAMREFFIIRSRLISSLRFAAKRSLTFTRSAKFFGNIPLARARASRRRTSSISEQFS